MRVKKSKASEIVLDPCTLAQGYEDLSQKGKVGAKPTITSPQQPNAPIADDNLNTSNQDTAKTEQTETDLGKSEAVKSAEDITAVTIKDMVLDNLDINSCTGRLARVVGRRCHCSSSCSCYIGS